MLLGRENGPGVSDEPSRRARLFLQQFRNNYLYFLGVWTKTPPSRPMMIVLSFYGGARVHNGNNGNNNRLRFAHFRWAADVQLSTYYYILFIGIPWQKNETRKTVTVFFFLHGSSIHAVFGKHFRDRGRFKRILRFSIFTIYSNFVFDTSKC